MICTKFEFFLRFLFNIRSYKDIGELMKRCETLVVTRDVAKESLKRCQDEIAKEEEDLAVFKEAQNERILELR